MKPCISYVSHHCDQIPDKQNRKDFWLMGFRLYSITKARQREWLAVVMTGTQDCHSHPDRSGSRDGSESRQTMHLKPPAPQGHFLQLGQNSQSFYNFSKQHCQVEMECSNTSGDILYLNHITLTKEASCSIWPTFPNILCCVRTQWFSKTLAR